MTSLLKLQDWCVDREHEPVIGPIALHVGAGELVTWMGPSGIGKTTALLSILGYRREGIRASGHRIFCGRELEASAILEQTLFIPQTAPFNPNWELKAFLMRLPWKNPESVLAGTTPGGSRSARVDSVLRELDIVHRSRATIAELSGGEAQRAAIAQLLLLADNNLKLVVADELVVGLDAAMADFVVQKIINASAQAGFGVMLALHDVELALHISDRICVLHRFDDTMVPLVIDNGSACWDSQLLHALLGLARYSMNPAWRKAAQRLSSELIEAMNTVGPLSAGDQALAAGPVKLATLTEAVEGNERVLRVTVPERLQAKLGNTLAAAQL